MPPLKNVLPSLPARLAERVREVHSGSSPENETSAIGEFVLYWMRTAVRSCDNQALSVAIHAANEWQLPVLVYQGVSERYPFASDRHHSFLLQGARDVQQQLAERKIAYALHVESPGNRGPHLKSLAQRASMVVTEDMPTEPLRRWTRLLCREVDCPVIAVDCACVVPMSLVGKAYDRAFEFRDATKQLYVDRIQTEPLQEIAPQFDLPETIDLRFDPVDLQNTNIANLVAECEIDHSIGPVASTVGGSKSGYERWEAFKLNGLSLYDRQRNDALIDGVSRMSAYLHYGMVSPLRIAREAAAEQSSGAKKYLDELLIWRELAYGFCFYRRDHGRMSAIPDWAIETLSNHESDERPELLSWETLARGRSGNALWDAAQRSLLIHGELHNNVRMTWGKAILNWTPNAKKALAQIIDLNHRYALDGRDPASYGGILWCLGQFDRPFSPEQPVFGTVRTRSPQQHARRLDPSAYQNKINPRQTQSAPTVAVVGAGLSGLICARTLMDQGFDVTVFEKSGGMGGRMATRRVNANLSFDHGAQYFTARDERFKRYVRSWVQDEIVQPWQGRIVVLEQGNVKEEKRGTDRFVATPTMNAIGKHLAAEIDVNIRTRVASLKQTAKGSGKQSGKQWSLASDSGDDLGQFDAAVVAVPAGQAAKLLSSVPCLADQAEATKMSGCWAVMLATDTTSALDFDAAFVQHSPLSWIALNNTKPGRDGDQSAWTLHATAEWTEQHINASAAEVEELLVNEFWNAVGLSPSKPVHAQAHLWRFALPQNPLPTSCLFDRDLQIGACGDWCGGPRVEGAFLSGMSMAGRIMSLAGSTNDEV
ncbi:FAD-dependent oxidoreductase [Stieleria marina]|uniref:Deoxyribodipyrimidine photo-lyase n=1 Tax=Stieleria marina TaxID=1930275 RepID=A0A517NQ50_9BACT|nr:Deoxyribodipyrimidine photo-lyase [Planctomycetes bacterium K23_9]